MVNIKYYIYIDGQSTKLLVNSIAEAKLYATHHIGYREIIMIECYCLQCLVSKWIYDCKLGEWFEEVVLNSLCVKK